MKKVGKTTKPFRYDLNQIPYDYTVEVRNRFKGLDLLELTPKKAVLFIVGDSNAKGGSQEIPGVTDKFGLGVQNKARAKAHRVFPEKALVIANNLFPQHKR